MRVVHEDANGDESVLASTVETADSLLAKAWGLRFRRSLPDGHALVFPFSRERTRSIDMLFVPFPIDVLWLRGRRVGRQTRLRPWIGVGLSRADTVVELPAGTADGVEPGDAVRIDGRGG